jgi:hypothetical protein
VDIDLRRFVPEAAVSHRSKTSRVNSDRSRQRHFEAERLGFL